MSWIVWRLSLKFGRQMGKCMGALVVESIRWIRIGNERENEHEHQALHHNERIWFMSFDRRNFWRMMFSLCVHVKTSSRCRKVPFGETIISCVCVCGRILGNQRFRLIIYSISVKHHNGMHFVSWRQFFSASASTSSSFDLSESIGRMSTFIEKYYTENIL